MIKIFVTLCSIIISIGTYAQSQCQVKGHIEGVKTDTLIVCVTNDQYNRTERLDTVPMKNGNFSYIFKEGKVRQVILTAKPQAGKQLFEDPAAIDLLMIPGECAIITGTLNDYKIGGSAFYTDMAQSEKLLAPLKKEFIEKRVEFSVLMRKGEAEKTVSDQYTVYIQDWGKRYSKAALDFIKMNPNSDFSGYLIPSLGENMKEGEALITERVKNGPMKSYIDAVGKMRESARVQKEAVKKIHVGITAPEFTLNDINGNPLSIYSLRGKYVLLDFWGSWCKWCIKGFPDMKEAYAKHKSKVEFLGIACNDKMEKWKDALATYKLPWLNVFNVGDVDVSALFAVKGYPTKIVIDPQGIIIKIVEGEDPEFYIFLDDIFQSK